MGNVSDSRNTALNQQTLMNVRQDAQQRSVCNGSNNHAGQ